MNIDMNKMLLAIPEPIENLQLPNPDLLTYYKDEQDRVLWIEGEIGDGLFELSKMILRYNMEDRNIPVDERKPIKIFINSPGGDLDSTLAFIGLMNISKTPIWTIDACWAYSAAGLILMAGHKRYALPNTECLIHSGSGQIGGSFEQTTEQMKNYKYLVDKMRDFILNKTKIDQKLFKKMSTKDWYIYTEEMLSLGIVDEIVDDLDILF
jgi:ATP-dependent Clp protease protease subunit